MADLEGLFASLQRGGLAGPLDLHFARLMCRLDDGGSEALALAAALVSRHTGEGHVCLPLDRASDGAGRAGEGMVLPQPGPWIDVLRRSAVVGGPGEFRPLILDGARLYLHRYWRHEYRLAAALEARAAPFELPDEQALKQALARLFPKAPETPDWQKVAAATAALRQLCVISGGPGTGKTSTVVRILALLVEVERAEQRIALAAPTGKAAARLQESIASAKEGLPVEAHVRAAIPEQAVTLHRLLGGRGRGDFVYGAENPLPLDVLVVDEASMVDIAMMDRLLLALPSFARLILLGDKDQLASVEAGAVLGDICAAATGFSAAFAGQVAEVTGEPVSGEGAESGLADNIVLLRHSYRFAGDSGIGRLADAVRTGDVAKAWDNLTAGASSGVAWTPAPEAAVLAEGYAAYLDLLKQGAPFDDVFDAYGRYRVLCAVRNGPRGVEEVNRMLERRLAHRAGFDPYDPWYPGRPVMVVRNDHALRLYNGDIGIVMGGAGGSPQVCFPAGDGGGCRVIPAARLPSHETAFAMTVHKSQGSEFDDVHLLLPEQDSPLLTRELIYTAITRARRSFSLSGPEALCRTAVARRLERWSGLARRLWGNGAE